MGYPYSKFTWRDRNVQYPNTYKDQNNISYTFTRDPGTITEEGTPITATRMNSIEDTLEDIYNMMFQKFRKERWGGRV